MKEKNNLNIENENKKAEKKAKKKWSKKKKAGVSCLVIVLIAAITAFSLIVVAPAAHLANKYDEPIYKFKIHSFVFPHIYHAEPVIIFPVFYFSNPRWEFEKDDRLFNVEYGLDSFGNNPSGRYRFFDDYQLEDIENWITDYLKENIYSNIDGVKIDVLDIIKYFNCQIITPESSLEFFSNTPESFKNRLNKNNKMNRYIYISADHFEDLPTDEEKEKIKEQIVSKMVDELEIDTNEIEIIICIIKSKDSIIRHNSFRNTDRCFNNRSSISIE